VLLPAEGSEARSSGVESEGEEEEDGQVGIVHVRYGAIVCVVMNAIAHKIILTTFYLPLFIHSFAFLLSLSLSCLSSSLLSSTNLLSFYFLTLSPYFSISSFFDFFLLQEYSEDEYDKGGCGRPRGILNLPPESEGKESEKEDDKISNLASPVRVEWVDDSSPAIIVLTAAFYF
jgi:hypothetical protein